MMKNDQLSFISYRYVHYAAPLRLVSAGFSMAKIISFKLVLVPRSSTNCSKIDASRQPPPHLRTGSP